MVDPLRALLRGCRPSPSARLAKHPRRPVESPRTTADAGAAVYSSDDDDDAADTAPITAPTKLAPELDFFHSAPSSASAKPHHSKPRSEAKQRTDKPDSPSPVFSSDSLHALVDSPRLHAGLTALGLRRATEVQRRAIPTLSAGHDAIAIAPTGSGKTLAYTLPILDQLVAQRLHLSKCDATFAVIIAPTKELTTQIARVIQRLVRLCQLHVDVLALVSRNACATARNNPHSPHIVVATPHALATATAILDKKANSQLGKRSSKPKPSTEAKVANKDGDSDEGQENCEVEKPNDDDDDDGKQEEEEEYESHGSDPDNGDKKNTRKCGLVLSKVRHVVLDEADELLRDQFVAQVDAALSTCGVQSFSSAGQGATKQDDDESDGDSDEEASDTKEETNSGPKVHMFSATLPPAMQELAASLSRSARRVVVGGGGYGGSAAVGGVSDTIDQRFHFVGGVSEQGKVLALRNLLRAGELKPPILVFVQDRQRAAALLRELSGDHIRVDAVHADRTAAARATAVSRFRTGSIWMLIATDLLARGLDFQHVNTVINYDLPQSPQAYLHRIGRTGRNGRPGTAFTLFTDQASERALVGHIAKIARAAGAKVPDWLVALAKPVQTDQLRAFVKRPPKRPAIGGPNRTSLSHRRGSVPEMRKRKQRDCDTNKIEGMNSKPNNDTQSNRASPKTDVQPKSRNHPKKKRKKSHNTQQRTQ